MQPCIETMTSRLIWDIFQDVTLFHILTRKVKLYDNLTVYQTEQQCDTPKGTIMMSGLEAAHESTQPQTTQYFGHHCYHRTCSLQQFYEHFQNYFSTG